MGVGDVGVASEPLLSLVMPAHNEVAGIASVIADAISTMRHLVGDSYEIVVVDDASTDGTGDLLDSIASTEPMLSVIHLTNNVGHGPALRAGWEAATGAWIAHLDSDDEIPTSELGRLWPMRHTGDLVLGIRTDRASPRARRLVTSTLRTVARVAARHRIADANTPCKLVRRDVLARALELMPRQAFAPSVLVAIHVARRGGTIVEVPVSVRTRQFGESWLVPTRLAYGAALSFRDAVVTGARLSLSRPEPVSRPSERPLRIAMMLQYYAPHRSGLTLHARRLAENLASRDHRVTVITARHDATRPRRSIENGVTVVRLWAPINCSRGMVTPFHPLSTWRTLRSADVVIVHSPMLETPLVALIARLRRTPLVITHHGDLVLPESRANSFIEWVVHCGWRFGAQRATRLVAYSDDYLRASRYLSPFADRATVIPPPVEIPEPRGPRVADLRREWGGGPVIGFVGRFVDEKRPDVALLALDDLLQTHPTARLVFAGQHRIPYENTWSRHVDLVRRLRHHVTFLGLLDDPQELADVYAACDVLVLPSDTECFALVQVEAMLCGTPVVASDIDGARVPVTATGMGRLAPPGDAGAFADAVRELLADPQRYVYPASHVITALGLDTTIDRYEQTLRDATAS